MKKPKTIDYSTAREELRAAISKDPYAVFRWYCRWGQRGGASLVLAHEIARLLGRKRRPRR